MTVIVPVSEIDVEGPLIVIVKLNVPVAAEEVTVPDMVFTLLLILETSPVGNPELEEDIVTSHMLVTV